MNKIHVNYMAIPNVMKKIALFADSRSWKSYLVGGSIADHFLGLPVKDYDIEVHGPTYQELSEFLSQFGKVDLVGKQFLTIKLSTSEGIFDFSIPRRDSKVDDGHKGFECEPLRNPTFKEAARRRDLTFNAMGIDLVTMELHDPFKGMNDLYNGICRATDSLYFSDDPLRPLRLMQLHARKAPMGVDYDTLDLCREMATAGTDPYKLPPERIFEEFSKLFLKADRPSIGLEFLASSEWMCVLPLLETFWYVEQDPVHHPEGDVGRHTEMVIDCGAKLLHLIPEDWKLPFMFGLLYHDAGKAKTTVNVNGSIISHGHESDPETLQAIEQELMWLTNQKDFVNKVLSIVKCHMRPRNLFESNAGISAWRRLHRDLPLDIAAVVCRCDTNGKGGRSVNDAVPAVDKCFEMHIKIMVENNGSSRIEPILMGRDLIKVGFRPGPQFTAMLNKAFEAQLDGETDKSKLLEIAKSGSV